MAETLATVMAFYPVAIALWVVALVLWDYSDPDTFA